MSIVCTRCNGRGWKNDSAVSEFICDLCCGTGRFASTPPSDAAGDAGDEIIKRELRAQRDDLRTANAALQREVERLRDHGAAEYARAIEDAARVADECGLIAIEDMKNPKHDRTYLVGCEETAQDIAEGIRALAPQKVTSNGE